MELIRPRKQQVWGWPAVTNFVLGGMAAGFYLLSLLIVGLQYSGPNLIYPTGFKLLAPALAGVGFASLMFEAGRPLRSRHLLRHLRRSWMSIETLAGFVFIAAAILDWFWPRSLLLSIAGIAAFVFLISQGFILYRARAVTAWNVSLMPVLFLISGFVTGSGLTLLLVTLSNLRLGIMMIGLIWAVLDLTVWLLYLRWSRDVAFQKATKALRRSNALILIIVIGRLFPIFLLSLLLALPNVNSGFGYVSAGLAGLAMIAGGAGQKVGLVLGVGYLRGVVLGQPKNNVLIPSTNSISASMSSSSVIFQEDHSLPAQPSGNAEYLP